MSGLSQHHRPMAGKQTGSMASLKSNILPVKTVNINSYSVGKVYVQAALGLHDLELQFLGMHQNEILGRNRK